jgi:hypothetical protein
VVTRPDGPLPADGITVVAIAPDGAERTLAHFGSDQLDGTFSGWPAPTTMSGDGYLAISTLVASGASIVQVADLRDSAAPVQIPDAEGWAGYWGPTGRLALTQNDGSIAIFDPATGRTDRVLVPPGVRVLEFPGLRWSETGGVLAQDDDIASNPTNVGYRGLLGEIRLDGAFEPGPVPEVKDGVGPRRTRPSGERLRCNVLEETTCDSDDTLMSIGDGVDEVWTETDPDLRIADYAWTRRRWPVGAARVGRGRSPPGLPGAHLTAGRRAHPDRRVRGRGGRSRPGRLDHRRFVRWHRPR